MALHFSRKRILYTVTLHFRAMMMVMMMLLLIISSSSIGVAAVRTSFYSWPSLSLSFWVCHFKKKKKRKPLVFPFLQFGASNNSETFPFKTFFTCVDSFRFAKNRIKMKGKRDRESEQIDKETGATRIPPTAQQCSRNENIKINFGKCHRKIKRKKNTQA